MKKFVLSLILAALVGVCGCVTSEQGVSPYLSGINVMHTQFETGSGFKEQGARSRAQGAGFKVLRFPGGLLADEYHWMQGETGEFVEFCDNIGAEKMITVNFKTGRVQEAANWVEFCNGAVPADIPDEWKRVPFAYNHKAPEGYFAYARKVLNRERPHKVKFWEIGNEIDWWNRIDAESYAQEAVNYARAMRQKDKDILIGACGSPLDDQWNKAILQIAGKYIDFLVIHIYGGPDKKYEDRQEEYRVLFSKNKVVEERLIKIKELIKKYAPHCRVAVTEGNTSYNEFKLGKEELRKLKSALWIARLKNSLIRQGVMVYCHWNLIDNDLYGVINRDGTVTPTYEVLKLYAENTGKELARIGTDCTRIDTDKLDYVITIDKERGKIYIMAVNMGVEPIEAGIELGVQGAGHRAQVKTLRSADGMGLESQKVEVAEGEVRAEGGKLRYKFEPYSLTCIEVP